MADDMLDSDEDVAKPPPPKKKCSKKGITFVNVHVWCGDYFLY